MSFAGRELRTACTFLNRSWPSKIVEFSPDAVEIHHNSRKAKDAVELRDQLRRRAPRTEATRKIRELDGAFYFSTSRTSLQMWKADLIEVLEIAVGMTLDMPFFDRDLGLFAGTLRRFIQFLYLSSLLNWLLATAVISRPDLSEATLEQAIKSLRGRRLSRNSEKPTGQVTRVKWWHRWDSGASEFELGEVRNFVAEVVFDDLKNIPQG
ncbi:hypothetical protein BGZ57DRAFT_1008743 [Hyaloscypha finlandica]|nr:hypothetical protein BGZ57DRAFT_1008743 [Hyaloscypha finlandica]